ncbi:MAG: hypothetical protein ACI9CD_000944, partial [Candidatus Deianiraeaceae bacterium]
RINRLIHSNKNERNTQSTNDTQPHGIQFVL